MRVTCHVIIFIIGLSPERCNYEVTQHPLKSVLGLCPRESGFCSSETKHGRKSAPRTKLLLSTGRSEKKCHKFEESVLVSNPDEYGFCRITVENAVRLIYLFIGLTTFFSH
jgi:hypothetical protein